MMRVLLALLVFGVVASGAPQREVSVPWDSLKELTKVRYVPTAERPPNKNLAAIIKGAKRINIYHLVAFVTSPDEQEPAGKKYFVGYEVLDFNQVNKKRASKLKGVLLNESNYLKSGETNKCTFTATVGLEIVSKKGTVTVLVSYRCEKMIFILKGQEVYRDVKSLKRFDEIAHELLKGELS